MPTDLDNEPRAGDVTPDSQRARYDARGGEVTSIGDELDQSYADGLAAGQRGRSPSAGGSRVRLQAPTLPSVGAPFLAWLFVVSAESFVNEKRPPVPSRLLVGGLAFAVLGLARGDAQRPAAIFGWGLVLATFYSAAPGKKPGALAALNALGGFLGGKYGNTAGYNAAQLQAIAPGSQGPAGPKGP